MKIFSRLISKSKRIFHYKSQISFLKFFGVVMLRKRTTPTQFYFSLIKNSGILTNHNDQTSYDLSAAWEKTDKLWVDGKYNESVKARKILLEDLYRFNEVEIENYFPPSLSIGFLGPMGHQALLGVHLSAQNLGILPKGTRTAIRVLGEEPKPLLDVFKPYLNYVNYRTSPAWTELPNHWHSTERLQLIRAHDGFIDLYEMIENVFTKSNPTPEKPLFNLDKNYIDYCQTELAKLGLRQDDWFVGLHIRNDGHTEARRNQPVESYLRAIEDVISRGGKVIRIGDTSMPPMPSQLGFIDLVAESNSRKDLHLYVLAKSLFFIGTSSGPSSVPALFGVPTLITNTTSIGRNVLSAAKNSIYIPKLNLDSKGKIRSFRETLKTPDAFGELELPDLRQLGIQLRTNSSEEIISAVSEMFEKIENNQICGQNEYELRVNEIRAESSWTSKGIFAVSFLERYQEELLK